MTRFSFLSLRSHEHNIVRTIHMEPAPDSPTRPAGPLGFSVGAWEGDTLVVTTTRVDWPLSDEAGTPQSPTYGWWRGLRRLPTAAAWTMN